MWNNASKMKKESQLFMNRLILVKLLNLKITVPCCS